MLFVSIGSVAIALSFYYYFGIAYVAEYVALFTSVSTAIYAILAEPKGRTEPILRITPLLDTPAIIGTLGLGIWIENVGYSIAKDIEVKCQLVPDGSIPLKDNGVFKQSLLTPKEIIKYSAISHIESSKLLSQQKLTIEVSYLNEDDKKQKPIKREIAINELEKGLREVKIP